MAQNAPSRGRIGRYLFTVSNPGLLPMQRQPRARRLRPRPLPVTHDNLVALV